MAVGLEYACMFWCNAIAQVVWAGQFWNGLKAIALSYWAVTAWELRTPWYQEYPCQQVGVEHHDVAHGQVKDLIHCTSQRFVLM